VTVQRDKGLFGRSPGRASSYSFANAASDHTVEKRLVVADPNQTKDLTIEGLRSLAAGIEHPLQPVSLRVTGGECVCLSGPSGAGKTLLLRAIADLDPSAGQVYLGEQERSQFSGPEWRRRVGFLAAEPAWWTQRVGDGFVEDPIETLQAIGLQRDVLEWQCERLSTGERQRLSLVRLLARAPRALLLDEPTSALDPRAREAAEKLIADYRLANAAAVLWVSHDQYQIERVSTRQLRIEAGRLREVKI